MWGSPLARSGQGLALNNGFDGMRATVTLPDTFDGRQPRARIEVSELSVFSATFQALDDEWPAAELRDLRGICRTARRPAAAPAGSMTFPP